MTQVEYTQNGTTVRVNKTYNVDEETADNNNNGNTHSVDHGDYKARDEELDEDRRSITSHTSNTSSTSNTSKTSSNISNNTSSSPLSLSSSYQNEARDVVDMYKICAITYGGSAGKYELTMKRRASSRILSIYDGVTEYNMHKWNECPSAAPGFFVSKSKADALRSAFPRGSKLLQSPRCLIRCRVATSDMRCRGNNGVFTAKKIRPVEIWNLHKVWPNNSIGSPPYWDIVQWKPSGIFK